MMRACGALAVVAVVLVCCNADPHQDQEGSVNGGSLSDHFDNSGHKSRSLNSLGVGNLARAVRESRYQYGLPYLVNRYEYPRPSQNLYVNRRNFDEIDQTSMPFPYKRFSRFYRPNYIDMPAFHEGKEEKRFHDVPMDEIDLSYFPIGSRR